MATSLKPAQQVLSSRLETATAAAFFSEHGRNHHLTQIEARLQKSLNELGILARQLAAQFALRTQPRKGEELAEHLLDLVGKAIETMPLRNRARAEEAVRNMVTQGGFRTEEVESVELGKLASLMEVVLAVESLPKILLKVVGESNSIQELEGRFEAQVSKLGTAAPAAPVRAAPVVEPPAPIVVSQLVAEVKITRPLGDSRSAVNDLFSKLNTDPKKK